MDGQNEASFTKSCLCLKVKMAIFYEEYIFDGQNNWAFPKSCLCSKVKMAIFSMQSKFGMDKIQGRYKVGVVICI